MGTRAAYGFHLNGTDYLTYCHFDGYYEELGRSIANFADSNSVAKLKEIVEKIELVSLDSTPTKEQIEECLPYLDTNVSVGSEDDWYCLLCKTQGDLSPYLGQLKYMIDATDMLDDTEYMYVIDLDEEAFKVYHGPKQPVAAAALGGARSLIEGLIEAGDA